MAVLVSGQQWLGEQNPKFEMGFATNLFNDRVTIKFTIQTGAFLKVKESAINNYNTRTAGIKQYSPKQTGMCGHPLYKIN